MQRVVGLVMVSLVGCAGPVSEDGTPAVESARADLSKIVTEEVSIADEHGQRHKALLVVSIDLKRATSHVIEGARPIFRTLEARGLPTTYEERKEKVISQLAASANEGFEDLIALVFEEERIVGWQAVAGGRAQRAEKKIRAYNWYPDTLSTTAHLDDDHTGSYLCNASGGAHGTLDSSSTCWSVAVTLHEGAAWPYGSALTTKVVSYKASPGTNAYAWYPSGNWGNNYYHVRSVQDMAGTGTVANIIDCYSHWP